MTEIKLNAYYGDEIRKVVLSHDQWGSGGYQVYIDKGFYGILNYLNGRWVLHSNTNLLTIDDIQILGEIIELYTKKAA